MRESRFHAFLRKDYKWIALIGGLIVSVTFTLKDKLSERQRDFTSSIDAATTFQKIREMNTMTNATLAGILSRIDAVATKTSKGSDATAQHVLVSDELSSTLSTVSSVLDDCEELIFLIPNRKTSSEMERERSQALARLQSIEQDGALIRISALPIPSESELSKLFTRNRLAVA